MELYKVGIIPAHAGSISLRLCRICARRDHPRSCGEYLVIANSLMIFLGSSPLMRGVSLHAVHDVTDYGIIPAHAGSIFKRVMIVTKWGDHPRSCGEYMVMAVDDRTAQGSSPLMRGV